MAIELNGKTKLTTEFEKLFIELGGGDPNKTLTREDLSDRDSPNVWEKNGKPVLLDKAIEKRDEILASHFPKHISDEIDAMVREKFPIF